MLIVARTVARTIPRRIFAGIWPKMEECERDPSQLRLTCRPIAAESERKG